MKSAIRLLFILSGIASTTNAVILRNFVGPGCTGNSVECQDWPESQCCGITRGSSTLFLGLPPLGVGSIHRAQAGNNGAGCGNVQRAGSGLSLCLDGPHRGSMWHTASCRDGRAEVCSRGDISQLTQSELSEGAECRGIAPPTKITLSDGYELLLGNDTTPEDVQRLLDIAVEIPFATIEDIPESLHRLAQ